MLALVLMLALALVLVLWWYETSSPISALFLPPLPSLHKDKGQVEVRE